jgi:hypothetical protein
MGAGPGVSVNTYTVIPGIPAGAWISRNVYVGWEFEGTNLLVLETLKLFQERVSGVVGQFARFLDW